MHQWSLPTAAIIGTILAFLMLAGILGNILVVMVTTRRKTRLLPGGVFIRCLAVVDAGGSANIIFMLVTVCLRGKWVFGNVGCQISGTLIVFFGAFSLHLLCIISINRYLKIAKPNLYNRVFSRTGTRILLVLPWIVPLMMSLAPSLGWSAHYFQFGKSICHFHFSTSVSYTVTFLVAIVMIPLGISAVSYSKMYCLVRKHTLAVQTSLNREGSASSHIEEIRSARIIFVLLVAFLMCYTPGSIINVLEMAGIHTPPLLDLLSITFVVFKHSQNPLLYGLLNRRYRKELMKLLQPLTRHCCCEWCSNLDDDSEEFTPSRKKSGGAASSIHTNTTPSMKSSSNFWGVVKGDANRIIEQKQCEHPQAIVTYKATDDEMMINEILQSQNHLSRTSEDHL